MTTEILQLRNGKSVAHNVVKIIGDGACFFRSISYLVYGNQDMAGQIRQQIVDYVVDHWNELNIYSNDSNGQIYRTSLDYRTDMSKYDCYGGLSELFAAGSIFPYEFEVYRDLKFYTSSERNISTKPIKRLRFSGNLSSGHFDAYLEKLTVSTEAPILKLSSNSSSQHLIDPSKYEALQTNSGLFAHTIIRIKEDQSSLFRSIAHVVYGNSELHAETRKVIVLYVVKNWTIFSNVPFNYRNSELYLRYMSRNDGYGGECELIAAGAVFNYRFEIYQNCVLRYSFGNQSQPIKRLRLTGNISNGHYDAYVLYGRDKLTMSPVIQHSKSPLPPITYEMQISQTKKELLRIKSGIVLHSIIPMLDDEQSLFRALSLHIYDTDCLAAEIREEVVEHVVKNWSKFKTISHKSIRQSFKTSSLYSAAMSKINFYGGYLELVAAGELFNYKFEVFRNGELEFSFGEASNKIKRLRVSGENSKWHFDVLKLYEENRLTISSLSPSSNQINNPKTVSLSPSLSMEQIVENVESDVSVVKKKIGKRRTRFTNKIRKVQIRNAATKYATINRDVHRTAAANYVVKNPIPSNVDAVLKYQKTHPDINKKAVLKYQEKHPEVHRDAVQKYNKNTPDVHRKSVVRYSQKNPDVHREAVLKYTEQNPDVNLASVKRYRENNIEKKRDGDKKYDKRRRTLPWANKALSGMSYNPDVAYEADNSISIGTMIHKCSFCSALKWKGETKGMCCQLGKVQLPPFEPLPEPLLSLLTDNHPEHQHFIERIRKYNGCFQMTSFGAKNKTNKTWMPTYKVLGQVYHMVGSLIPEENQKARYLQVYFVGEDQRELDVRCSNYPDVKKGLVEVLQKMLHTVNSYIRDLKTAFNNVASNYENYRVVIHSERVPTDAHKGRFNAPTTNEVALVMVDQQFEKRDIVLQFKNNNLLKRISEIHRSYDALQYPLMFCYGEDGYSINLPLKDLNGKPLKKTVSAKMFYAYRIMVRAEDFNRLLRYGPLFSQYLVDMYAKIQTERLNFIRHNQAKLRVEQYGNLRDALHGKDDADPNNIGQKVILPSTFTGGARYLHEKTQDAITYVRYYGSPDLFITFTCNPKWKDITEALLPGQKWFDRHDIVARVFNLKVKVLMHLMTTGCLFGEVRCFIYTVEWQKRGLPHVHILIWLKKKLTSNQIDNIVCAEIPDPINDPILHEIVKSNMIHGPCGVLNPKCICMQNNSCSKRYPKPYANETLIAKNGYPMYRRRSPANGGQTIKMKNHDLDNGWVVPYNPVLLRTFNAHINVEYCCDIKAIKYILKYINKGSDQAAISLEKNDDEIAFFETGRYLSSNEGVWRIFGFNIHERFPTVQHLAVHLENGQRIYFNEKNLPNKLSNPPKTTLTGFFELCKIDKFALTLLYHEVPNYYTWGKNKFSRRKIGTPVPGWPDVLKSSALGRIYNVHPNNTDCYHLRLLLHEVRGPTCFNDLKKVDGVICSTFQAACNARGLLDNGKHWVLALEEAQICVTPYKMRELFTIMLVFCHLPDPLSLWEKFKFSLADDIIRRVDKENENTAQYIMDLILNECLILIEDQSLRIGGSFIDSYGLPKPTRTENNLDNREYIKETSYNSDDLAKFVNQNEILLTAEQLTVYRQVLDSIDSDKGIVFFLDAPGGTGKTFLLNLILAKVRSCRKIALATASSGIAATLLSGGKTAHAAFKIPFNLLHMEDPNCLITKQSDAGRVLKDCKLIVWDESTMAHKLAFEALDRTLRDFKSNDCIMGGMTVLLAGDFRQTLPVIPRGTRADEVNACIKKSLLWTSITKLGLKENMRVKLGNDESADQFSKLLLEIGNGNFKNTKGVIDISENLGVKVKSLEELIAKIYPNIKDIHQKSMDWFCERAILCPKNNRANDINNILLKSFEGEEIEYKSVDTVLNENQAVNYPVEFLNSQNPSGIPAHRLCLKVGTPIMLLRNLNPPKLCNGTRLQVKSMKKNIIEGTILTGSYRGESVCIPRIPLIPSDYPIEFKRLQFPVKVCFAMTINKSQGQSLKIAGIDLREDCFSHGQFYVGCSRVSSPKSLILLAPEGKAQNVVYKEVL